MKNHGLAIGISALALCAAVTLIVFSIFSREWLALALGIFFLILSIRDVREEIERWR